MRFEQDWSVLLLIFAVGLLTGLIVFMAADQHPDACRSAIMHVPGRAHLTWVCSRP